MNRLILAAAAGLFATAAQAGHLDITMQGATFKGDSVTFPSVMIDKDGWLVIHAMKDGAPVLPTSLGSTFVPAGTTKNVAVEIDGKVMKGTDYLVMLHYETNANGTYDFGANDTTNDGPALKADKSPYMTQFRTGM